MSIASGWSPPVYVARRRVIPLFNPRGQLFDQRDRQIPGAGGGLPQRGEVDVFVPATLNNGIKRRLRHEAAFDLSASQRGFKIQHPCTRCASLNQAVSGLVRIIGVNKLIMAP